jgi:membrane protease subunit HflC
MDSGHDHDHGLPLFHTHVHPPGAKPRLWGVLARLLLALCVVGGLAMAACTVMVGAGEAVVITAFGDPVRVLTAPGLATKLPAPLQTAIRVDLRLRTTSTGLQDVGTRDGLRILVQAFVVWRVKPEPESIKLFLRAVRGDPDEAARQIRGFAGSALQISAGGFDLANLVNTDPDRVRLAAFEQNLQTQLAQQLQKNFGIEILRTGIERLTLPQSTLAATVARMRSERETVAAERTAEGLRQAAEIRSEAARDSRIAVAEAQTQAAGIEAAARKQAADIQAKAYTADPDLYTTLRSLDTLANVIGTNTRLVLRTDAAPFNALVQGPAGESAK